MESLPFPQADIWDVVKVLLCEALMALFPLVHRVYEQAALDLPCEQLMHQAMEVFIALF